tara:strand:+ start:557 stop:703 length:147 start_codon:yes stop_codon:yes gene_type:complete
VRLRGKGDKKSNAKNQIKEDKKFSRWKTNEPERAGPLEGNTLKTSAVS